MCDEHSAREPDSSALAEVVLTGFGAGLAFLCGITLIGGEVDDAVRGRVFAFVQTAARAALLLAVAGAGALAGAVSTQLVVLGPVAFELDAARPLYGLAGACGIAVGTVALRRMAGADFASAERRHDSSDGVGDGITG